MFFISKTKNSVSKSKLFGSSIISESSISISDSSFDIRSLEDKEESSILLAALICGPKTKPISLAKQFDSEILKLILFI